MACEVDGDVLRNPDGAPDGMVFVLRDITARKRSEDALRESEKRYQNLVESAHDWVWEVDSRGVYTFAGPQVRALLGYEPEEILGKQPFDLMPPEEATRVKAEFDAIAAEQKTFWCLENVNRHRDGRFVILETNGIPIFNAHGQFRGYRGMDRDITERKWSREALRLSEEKFAKAFYASPDSININRLRDGLYVDINAGFTSLTGYERDEVTGRTSVDISLWNDRADRDRLVAKLMRVGQVDNMEARFRLKNGTVRMGQMSARIITLDNEPHILSITRDIHDRKRAEEALQESEKRFRRITESMNDLVAEADNQARYRYASPSFRTVLGLEPEALIGEWVFQRVHPDDLGTLQKIYSSAIEDGEPRHHRPQTGGRGAGNPAGAVDPGAENGSNRPPGRRNRSRFQQHPDSNPRLQRAPVGRRPRGHKAARGRDGDAAGGRTGGSTNATITGLQSKVHRPASISLFMRHLEWEFASYYNRRKCRRIAFWNERFHSILEDFVHRVAALRRDRIRLEIQNRPMSVGTAVTHGHYMRERDWRSQLVDVLRRFDLITAVSPQDPRKH